MMERKPGVSDEDWRQYFCTMDAIESRNPRRVKPSCLDMLDAKCRQIRDSELRADAFGALRMLEEATGLR